MSAKQNVWQFGDKMYARSFKLCLAFSLGLAVSLIVELIYIFQSDSTKGMLI